MREEKQTIQQKKFFKTFYGHKVNVLIRQTAGAEVYLACDPRKNIAAA